jgi:hypothetical protein
VIYSEIDEIPEDSKELVKRLLKKGVIDIDKGKFQISSECLEVLKIISRLGYI